jgi:hypothetical protein
VNEKAVSIAARFYEARTRVREILGDQWRPVIQKYMDAIRKLGAKNNLSTLDAAKVCIQFSLQDQDAIGAMKFMAACVEIIEPSPKIRGPATPTPVAEKRRDAGSPAFS